MSTKVKVVAAILMMAAVTVVATVAATSVVSASVPKLLLPLGTSQYAAVSATVATSTSSLTFVDVPGLSQSFVVPAGKSADVLVFFCGETRSKDSVTLARAVIAGLGVLAPPFMQIREHTLGAQFESQCANFYRPRVVAPATGGPLTVKIQWRGAGGLQEMRNRSMIVVLNIH